jgi:hypothetical protein
MSELTLTNKEALFIETFVGLLYAEPGFSDVDASDMIRELAPKGLNNHAVAGLISSLEAKGVIETVDGIYQGIDFDIIYLNNEELHPEWSEDNGVDYVDPKSLVI